MKNFGELETWSDVQKVFNELEKQRIEATSLVERKRLDAYKAFGSDASFYVPNYDLNSISVQRGIVNWFEDERSYVKASSQLISQNEARLMSGFRYAAEMMLGPQWESEPEFQKNLLEEVLNSYSVDPEKFDQLTQFSQEQITKVGYAFARLMPSFSSSWLKSASKAPPHVAIIKHWTDPDFPLWLMKSEALSDTINYLSPRSQLAPSSVITTLKRLNLKRLRHNPIQGIEVKKLTNGKPQFCSFRYATYLEDFLESVPVNTRSFAESRRIRLDGSHFRSNSG